MVQSTFKTIQECVIPFAAEIDQDNAPPHKTQVVLKSLEDLMKEKVHLQHPTTSALQYSSKYLAN